MNPSQNQAVKNADAAISYFIGPPGTGKTTVVSAITSKILSSDENSVLLVAETNQAVRSMHKNLLQNGVVTESEINLIVSHKYWTEHKNRYDGKPGSKNKKSFRRVVLSTMTMAISLMKEGLASSRDKQDRLIWRNYLIIDESSLTTRLTTYELLPFLGYFRHLIFSGDMKQQTPFCFGNFHPFSILEFLERHVKEFGNKLVAHTFLNCQYRMPYDMGNMISENFYQGRLKSYRRDNGKNTLFFIDIKSNMISDDTGSWYAPNEVKEAVLMAIRISKISTKIGICILVMYQAEKFKIIDRLKRENGSLRIRCHTVDSFQGGEDDVIILCSCSYGEKVKKFIRDRRRMCVSLSRARERLIILGEFAILNDELSWKNVLKSFAILDNTTKKKVLIDIV